MLYLKIIIFFSALSGTASPVLSDTLRDQIHWANPNWTLAGWIIIGIILFIGLRVFLNVRREKKLQLHEKKISVDKFFLKCDENSLTEEESNKLMSILEHESIKKPHAIFDSMPLFEKCVHAEVNKLIFQRISREKRVEEGALLADIRKKLGFNYVSMDSPLISTRNISIGQIGSVYGTSPNVPGSYIKVIDHAVVSDKREFIFQIKYDIQKEDIYRISPGDRINFSFTRQNDGIYGIPVIVERGASAGVINLYHTLDLKRTQLRDDVRIDIDTEVPILFYSLKSPKYNEAGQLRKNSSFEGNMIDISGGGFSFECDTFLKQSDITAVNFELDGESFIDIMAQVVRVKTRETEINRFVIQCQFIELTHRKREKIIRYIFKQQRRIKFTESGRDIDDIMDQLVS
ncbi:putative PilZ domain-containing protein [Candidatus Magnetomoraceae bacterium gMMP-15]